MAQVTEEMVVRTRKPKRLPKVKVPKAFGLVLVLLCAQVSVSSSDFVTRLIAVLIVLYVVRLESIEEGRSELAQELLRDTRNA